MGEKHIGWRCLSLIVISGLLLASHILSCKGDTDGKNADNIRDIQYEVVSVDEVSYAGCKRFNLRIRVSRIIDLSELNIISRDIIENFQNKHAHNALTLFYYLPDSDPYGLYTAGKAEWAPYGDYSKADQVQTGDYSKHKLIGKTGNAFGIDTKKTEVSEISLETKKNIFYDLVAAQDRGVGDEEAFHIIAQQYGVEVEIIEKIGIEGIVKGWPMP